MRIIPLVVALKFPQPQTAFNRYTLSEFLIGSIFSIVLSAAEGHVRNTPDAPTQVVILTVTVTLFCPFV